MKTGMNAFGEMSLWVVSRSEANECFSCLSPTVSNRALPFARAEAPSRSTVIQQCPLRT